jgi:glycosyltransferase involved in cell wall biosynthesis
MNFQDGKHIFSVPGYTQIATGGFLLNLRDAKAMLDVFPDCLVCGHDELTNAVGANGVCRLPSPKLINKLLAIVFINGDALYFGVCFGLFLGAFRGGTYFQEGTRSWIYPFLAKILGYNVILRAHNIEREYLRGIYLDPEYMARNGILENLKNKVKYCIVSISEYLSVKSARKVLVLTDHDKKHFSIYCNNVKCIPYYPTLIPRISDFPPSEGVKVIFVGSLGFLPNKDAHDKILAVAGSVSSDISFHFYGNKGSVNESELKNVHYHGFCEELEIAYRDADVFICPIYKGAGMKLKVAESLSYGVPVLLSLHSLRGYEGAPGVSVLDIDDANISSTFTNLKRRYTSKLALQAQYVSWISSMEFDKRFCNEIT